MKQTLSIRAHWRFGHEKGTFWQVPCSDPWGPTGHVSGVSTLMDQHTSLGFNTLLCAGWAKCRERESASLRGWRRPSGAWACVLPLGDAMLLLA